MGEKGLSVSKELDQGFKKGLEDEKEVSQGCLGKIWADGRRA